jgi:hypothetical protein
VGITAFTLRNAERTRSLSIENLSASGALLVGDGFAIGETLELELVLSRDLAVHVRALVVRLERRRDDTAVAVQFKDLAPDAENAILKVVERAIERTRAEGTPAIVAITSHTEDVEPLGSAIVASGLQPLVVLTFLDALCWLQDPHVRVTALAVDLQVDRGSGLEVLSWCAEAFPTVRRVLICRAGESEALGKLRCRIAHAILVRPLETRRLWPALGVTPVRQSPSPQRSSWPSP